MLRSGEITDGVIGAAIEVRQVLGPGLLESIDEEALAHELGLRDVAFRRQVALPVRYKGRQLQADCRIDLIVAEEVVVELKAVESVLPVHEAQLMTYLRLSGKRTGLLINFNVAKLKDGIVRRVL